MGCSEAGHRLALQALLQKLLVAELPFSVSAIRALGALDMPEHIMVCSAHSHGTAAATSGTGRIWNNNVALVTICGRIVAQNSK